MNSFREILVQRGPIKLKEKDFPKDDHRLKFSVMYYKVHFPTGELKENGLFQEFIQHILFSVQNIFIRKKDHKTN